MLKQEINLYQAFEKPQMEGALVTWRQFWIANASMIALMITIYIILFLQVSHLSNKKNNLFAELNQLQHNFNEAKSKYPSLFFSQDIQQSIQQIEKNVTAERNFLNALTQHIPFSQKLVALARVSIQNVWLNNISITNATREIILKGNSVDALSIQTYLGNIQKDPILSSFTLTVNNIDTTQNKDGSFAFQLTLAKKV